MSERITLSELARRVKHNKGYIHRLKVKGILQFDDKGLIEYQTAIQAIENSKDLSKGYMEQVNDRQREVHRGAGANDERMSSQASESQSASFMKAKVVKETYAAKTAELEYKEKIGLYVLKKEVDSSAFEMARAMRDGLTNSARRIAAELSGASKTASECEEIIDKEHRHLLENLVKTLMIKSGIDVSTEAF